MTTERDELRIKLLGLGGTISSCWPDRGGTFDQQKAERAVDETVDAILAAGYRKTQQVTTPEEANELPDRSAILTPGQIIFRKWADYYGEGKDGWGRELGQVVPAELLDEDSHFPATVLHMGGGQ